ncbi:MAG: hypothetical protein R2822_24595 [Spirosomataceae bacterium]
MKIFLIILIFLSMAVGGCQQERISSTNEDCAAIKITSTLDTLTSVDMFSIKEAMVSGNTLRLTFAYGGGCDPNHSFELYLKPTQNIDANTSNFEGRVVFHTQDYCKRLDTKSFCFDLTSLKKGANSIQIKIQGFGEVIGF